MDKLNTLNRIGVAKEGFNFKNMFDPKGNPYELEK
jgi:hypothetical protein